MRSLPTMPMRPMSPARHVGEPHGAAGVRDFVGRGAAGVGRRHNGSGAHSGDAMNGNPMTLEHIENAGMGNPACKTASESQPDGHWRMPWAAPPARRSVKGGANWR